MLSPGALFQSHTDWKGVYTNALVDVHRSGCYSWRKLHESGRLVLAYSWMLCVAYNLESNKGAISMTENEAVELLRSMQNPKQDYANVVCAPAFCTGFRFVYPEPEDYAIEEAIKALEEIQQYRKIGTVEECREAVEKQKAKKPDIYTDTRNMVDLHGNVYAEQANVYLCPTCESFIGYVGNDIFHYCPVCGQAIDENLEGMENERD